MPEFRFIRAYPGETLTDREFASRNGFYSRGETAKDAMGKLPKPPRGYLYRLDTRSVPWKN